MTSLTSAQHDACLKYYESYIDCMDNLSLDMQAILSKIKEIDISYSALTKQIPLLAQKMLENHNNATRKKLLSAIMRVQEIQLLKLELTQNMSDMIHDKASELDRNYKLVGLHVGHLDSSFAESTSKESNVSESGQQRQNKRGKRGKVDNHASAVGNDYSHGNSHQRHQYGKSSDSSNLPGSASNKTGTTQPSKKTTVATTKKKKRKTTSRHSRRGSTKPEDIETILANTVIDPDEPTYCLCDQISYGEMICCDNDLCPIEWFHFACVSLTLKPKGKWFCPKCRGDRVNVMKPKSIFLKELEMYNKEKEEKATQRY